MVKRTPFLDVGAQFDFQVKLGLGSRRNPAAVILAGFRAPCSMRCPNKLTVPFANIRRQTTGNPSCETGAVQPDPRICADWRAD